MSRVVREAFGEFDCKQAEERRELDVLVPPPVGATRRRPPPTPCSVAFGALRVAGRRWFRRVGSGSFALLELSRVNGRSSWPLLSPYSRDLAEVVQMHQSQQSRRAPPAAHAPRHMPLLGVIDGSHVSRILRELWRSPAALLGAGRNMFNQRQQLKRQTLLAERAHVMRHQPTPSEIKLWAAISAGQLGVAFKRQVPIGNFIVDFLAPAVKLVVEVDGGSHVGRAAADARRDRKLARLGYRVVRLEAGWVISQTPLAIGQIRSALQEP